MEIVAVIGSRTRNKDDEVMVRALVGSRMKALPTKTVFISGGCYSGADKWCKHFCGLWGLRYLEAPALWNGALRLKAGPQRNRLIGDICTKVLAFWDGKSPGTKQTIEYCRSLGKPVEVIPV